MGTLANKSPKDTYKSLLKVENEINGITTALSKIEDGEGTASCLSISDDSIQIQPENDNNVITFRVRNSSGATLFNIDTSNNVVKVGSTQTPANTQILSFKAYKIVPSGAGHHMYVPLGGMDFGETSSPELANGTGTDPLTSDTVTDDFVCMLFNVPLNITIDAVKVFAATDQTTDCVLNYHLMSYTISNDGDTDDGDLSSGTVIADGQATAVDSGVIKQTALTIQSASVAANKVLAFFVENETNTDDITINAQVLYHID